MVVNIERERVGGSKVDATVTADGIGKEVQPLLTTTL